MFDIVTYFNYLTNINHKTKIPLRRRLRIPKG